MRHRPGLGCRRRDPATAAAKVVPRPPVAQAMGPLTASINAPTPSRTSEEPGTNDRGPRPDPEAPTVCPVGLASGDADVRSDVEETAQTDRRVDDEAVDGPTGGRAGPGGVVDQRRGSPRLKMKALIRLRSTAGVAPM